MLGQPIKEKTRAIDLLKRPDITYEQVHTLTSGSDGTTDRAIATQLEVEARYAPYIERQNDEIERRRRHETMTIPDEFDYTKVRGLSKEVADKLLSHRPASVGHAARISGVTPAAISLLLVHLHKRAMLSAA